MEIEKPIRYFFAVICKSCGARNGLTYTTEEMDFVVIRDQKQATVNCHNCRAAHQYSTGDIYRVEAKETH